MELSNCNVVLNRITDEEICRLCVPARDDESVISARCGMEFPNCTVVLNRITDEEIRGLCAPGRSTESASEVQDKAGLKTRKRTRCGKTRRKIRSGKQVAAKTENTDEFESYKLESKSFVKRKISGWLSDFTLSWSSDETESEPKKRKKKVKRRRKLKRIPEMSDSSVNIAFEAVVNVHSSSLNSDANSSLQSSNSVSKCDPHKVETSTLDTSANHLSNEQIDNTGQSCGIFSNSDQFCSYSSFEDIPLSTLKNMSNLEYKNILTFFNREIQSNSNKKTNTKLRKRKRLKISSQNEKPGSNGDSENFSQLKKSTIEIKQLDESVEKNEVDVICSPLLTTFKESGATFPSDHDSGGLHKSPNYDWNNDMSLKSSKGELCTSQYHSRMDNLPPIDYDTNKCLKSNENWEIKKEKEAESQIPKIFIKYKFQEYFIEKEQKTSLEVDELDGKSNQLIREGRKEENSTNKVITNNATKISVKSNEPNEKSNHPKSQNNDDETVIVSPKKNQSGRSPKHLILNKMVEDYQTVQTLDETISHDTREDIKINPVNTTHMEKEPYIYKFRFSKGVNTDSISVTKSNLNNTSPPINISLDVNKWKLKLKTKEANSNASFKSDQSDMALYLQHRYKLLVGNQGKDYQLTESFGEKTADNRLDLSNFPDFEDKCHLQGKCQKLQVLEKLKSVKSCKLHNIKKTPESTDIKDASAFLYSSPTVLSNVQANYLYPQENFQNKIPSHKNLTVFTSPPQFDDKTDFNKILPYVKSVTKDSTTKPSEIPPLMTSSGLPRNTFFATDISVNENANTVLPCANNSSLECSLINPPIPYLCSERYFSTKIPTYSTKKAKMSDFASCDSVNTQNGETVSYVYSTECFENMNSHLTEFHKMAPVRLDININDLKSKANETNMSVEKNSCLLSNTERESTSEMHSKKVAELCTNDSLKETYKSENVLSATDILEVVAKLAISDLDKNPQSHLKAKVAIGKTLVKKLLSKKRITSKLKDLINSIQYDLYVLNIAEQYLHFYGSFSKVSEYFLKDHKRSDPVRK